MLNNPQQIPRKKKKKKKKKEGEKRRRKRKKRKGRKISKTERKQGKEKKKKKKKILGQILLSLVGNDSSSKVTQDMRASSLNSSQIPFAQKQLNQSVSAVGVVKENKKTPVNQPGPLLEGDHVGGSNFVIDLSLQELQVSEGIFPPIKKKEKEKERKK